MPPPALLLANPTAAWRPLTRAPPLLRLAALASAVRTLAGREGPGKPDPLPDWLACAVLACAVPAERQPGLVAGGVDAASQLAVQALGALNRRVRPALSGLVLPPLPVEPASPGAPRRQRPPYLLELLVTC